MVRWRPGIVMITLLLSIAGCGTPRRTITGSEAIQRLDGYVAEAVAAAPSGISLVRSKAEATYGGGCTKGLSDSDFTGQVEAELVYEAELVHPGVGAAYVDTIGRLWKKRWAAVERAADGVRVSVDHGRYRLFGLYDPGTGLLRVGGVSECIWPNGTPGPEDNP